MSAIPYLSSEAWDVIQYYNVGIEDEIRKVNSEIQTSNPNLIDLSNRIYKLQMKHSKINNKNIDEDSVYGSMLKNKKRFNEIQYSILNDNLTEKKVKKLSKYLITISKICSDLKKYQFMNNLFELRENNSGIKYINKNCGIDEEE